MGGKVPLWRCANMVRKSGFFLDIIKNGQPILTKTLAANIQI